MTKKTTIYDIAKVLNITAATVSRALNDNKKISKKTRALVLATANEMNYEQNKLAVALKSGKSYAIGVIVPRIDNSFFGSVIRGIEDQLAPLGYHVIITQTHEIENREAETIDTLLNAQVDAILMSLSTTDTPQTYFDRILSKNIPLIFFDRKKNMKGASFVGIDDFAGGYKATEHLIKQGCKKIAHFSVDSSVNIYIERFKGYKQALIDHGYPIIEDHIVEIKSKLEDGADAMSSLLKLKNPPDALFSTSDLAALGAIQVLKKHSIKIPEDFAVVGFSNEPFTRFMELTMSTVDQSPEEMGRMAAKVFLEQVKENSVKIEKKVIIEPNLIIRKSSCKKIK